MKLVKLLGYGVAAVVAGHSLSAQEVNNGTQQARRPFVIVAEELPPYEFADANGKPSGINVELIDRIFGELGIPYEIRFYPWARAWLMVENGAADAVLSVSYQPERAKHLYFTEEQAAAWESGRIPPDFLWVTEYVFFIAKRHQPSLKFESYQQIREDNLRVLVNAQYSYDREFMQSGITRESRPTPLAAMQGLLAGEGDLYPMDRNAGWAMLQKEGLREQVTWLPKPLFNKPYLMGFSRQSSYPGNEDLMRRFYARLREMRHSGLVSQITSRHLDTVRPIRPDRPVRFVCEEWHPFEYQQDDQVKGLNPAMVDKIMKCLRIPYEIRIYPWARAWLMAERGQAEAVISVSYHPDRDKVLYYTDGQRKAAQEGKLPNDYLWISRYAFFVKAQRAAAWPYTSYDQMIQAGCKVGLNQGYSYSPTFPATNFTSTMYFDTQDGFMGLIRGEIDAYPMDLTVGRDTLRNIGMEQSITNLPGELFTKPYLCPFVRASDYPGLESIMYEFYHQLRQMRASGVVPY